MATLFTVGIEVQTSAAQQAIARMERVFDEFARSSQSATRATQQFDQELDDATRELNQFADEMEQANRRQADFERGSLAVAAGLAGVAFKAKQYINAVIGVGQATQSAIAANSTLAKDAVGLDKAFRELTKELNYSTNSLELNQAAYDVLSAGVSETTDVINVMKAGVAGAKGGFSDLATMTDAVTTIMNAYGKSSSEAQKIVDMMITTQNDGKIVAAQYGQQIGVVAAGAASAGVKLEELNAAISVATVAGVQTSSTFSGLRQAISSIVSPSEQAKKIAKELGIEFSQAGLQQKGFAGVLKDVAEATKGNAEQITKLFGSVEAKAVIDPILNNLQKYDQFLQNQIQTSGAAADAQKKLGDRLQASAAAFANVRKEVEIDIFKTIEPAVTALTKGTTALAKTFVDLPEPLQKVAIGIGLVGAAVVTTTAAVIAFKALGITTAVVMGSLSTAVGIILNPIGLLAIAVGGAYLAFQQMMEASEELRKVMETALPRIGKVAEQIFGGIASMVDRLTGKYAEHESKSEGIFKRMGDWMAKFFEETISGWERLGRAMDEYMVNQERRAGVGGIAGLSMTEVERNIMSGNLGDGRNTRKILQMEMKRLNTEIAMMEQEAQRFRNSGMGIPNVKLEEDIKKKIKQFDELRNAYNRVGTAVSNYNKMQAEANKAGVPTNNNDNNTADDLNNQNNALNSQIAKQRALADLEITRMQQRLDLEKAYGQISQEEILRREAAIRLRRNELSLATLAVEKAEQEQRIKNGENVNRQDFSAQEQALREDSAFVQQKLIADFARIDREYRQKEEARKLKSEQDFFNLRKDHELQLFRLQTENARNAREMDMRGRNEVERAVLAQVNRQESMYAEEAIKQAEYVQKQNELQQQYDVLDLERRQIGQMYPSGSPVPPEVASREWDIYNRMSQLNEQLKNNREKERVRHEGFYQSSLGAERDLLNIFVDQITKAVEEVKTETDRIRQSTELSRSPLGAQPSMRAGMAIESIYGAPKNKLIDAMERSRLEGDEGMVAVYQQQIKQLDTLFNNGVLSDTEKAFGVYEDMKAIADREGERTQFESSLRFTAEAEARRTGEMQSQLQLMRLQGDEKDRMVATLRAEEIIDQRRKQLQEQMEGAPEDSMYYTYMKNELESLSQLLPVLTSEFYVQQQAQSALTKEIDLFNEQLRMTQAIADGMGDSFSSAFGEFVMGTKSAQEAFAGMMGNMANVFLQEFQRMTAQKAAAGLMGLVGNLFGMPTAIGAMGFGDTPQASLSGIGQFAFGGGAGSSGFSAANVAGFGQPLGMPLFNAFADGGIVTKPMMGLVGEAGREAIIPLDKLDGMGNNVSIVVNVSNDGSVTTDQQNASQLGRELESAVVAVLQKQKRPGGLLASVR